MSPPVRALDITGGLISIIENRINSNQRRIIARER